MANILGSTDMEQNVFRLCRTFCRLLTPLVARPEEEALGRQDSKKLTPWGSTLLLDCKAPKHCSPALQALRTQSCSAF